LTLGSLFSGIGGFELGFEAAGFECLWQVEQDKHCQNVLRQHWPNAALHGDIKDINGRELTPVDVVTYGFPCQDLSIAGRRRGLDGERSGLFFEAIRIFKEMREATNGQYPRAVVAENVIGLLSADGGDAMGRCLEALAEIGAVGIEWRVLDAQYFGVPQRRRRVFLVAVFDSRALRRGQIFPEPSIVRWNSEKGESPGQEIAGTLGGGSGNRGWSPDTDRMTFVKAARARTKDDSETWKENGPCPTLNGFDNGGEARATVVSIPKVTGSLTTAFGPKNYSNVQEVMSGSVISVPNPNLPQITGSVVTTWAKGPGNAQVEGGHVQPVEEGPRRLTPMECERLQGFPDGHTSVGGDGKPISDSQRYKMCGNAVAVPVAEWVGRQIRRILAPE
jgi:DNA (cytosine-5)-methyltransferase 1